MSGRLIYRCGRFLDQGYVTLSGGSGINTSKRSDDEIWKTFREHKPIAGASGHVWTVLSEGRDVQEVLAFVHNTVLSPEVESSITAKLGVLAEKELPEILVEIRKRKLAPSEARSVLNKRLDRFADVLSVDLPKLTPRKSIKESINGTFNDSWKLISVASIVVLLLSSVLGFLAYRDNGTQVTDWYPTRAEVVKVASLCYPEISSSSQVDGLIEAFGGSPWRHSSSNTHDFLIALTDQQRSNVRLKDQRPETLCSARTSLWKLVADLEKINATEVISSLSKTDETLPNELGDGAKAIETMKVLVDNLSQNPVPSQPVDCEFGLCLPLITSSDIELTKWLANLYSVIELSFDVDLRELPYRLRASEVELRGELSLAGISTTDLLTQFAPLWECGAGNGCALPLLESLDLVGLEVP